MDARKILLGAALAGLFGGTVGSFAAAPVMKTPPAPPWRHLLQPKVTGATGYRLVETGPYDLTPRWLDGSGPGEESPMLGLPERPLRELPEAAAWRIGPAPPVPQWQTEPQRDAVAYEKWAGPAAIELGTTDAEQAEAAARQAIVTAETVDEEPQQTAQDSSDQLIEDGEEQPVTL